jgi:hypothetical protein
LSAIACVRFCTIARRHLADCEHPDDGACRGCLPRPAEFGALCIACHYRFVRILHDLPHARTLLAGHLQPSYARRDNMVKATKGDPPVPLNLSVLDLSRPSSTTSPSAGLASTPKTTTSRRLPMASRTCVSTSRPSSAPHGSPTHGPSSPTSPHAPTPSSRGDPRS